MHEATLKRKHDLCRLLLKRGANSSMKTQEGETALDLALRTTADEDLVDILRGHAALLDACKRGDLAKVKKLLAADPDSVNSRDLAGRCSAPLHLAAGYNHLKIAECLLAAGADTVVRDKGGLIPLHNAASYGVRFKLPWKLCLLLMFYLNLYVYFIKACGNGSIAFETQSVNDKSN